MMVDELKTPSNTGLFQFIAVHPMGYILICKGGGNSTNCVLGRIILHTEAS